MNKQHRLTSLIAVVATLLAMTFSGMASAKSMYVIANINASPTPMQTYDIQAAPTYLVFQATANVPSLAGGAVGLALDEDSEKLFVTYEVSNTIQLVDARTFAVLSQTTAPGASNLAGVAVDRGRNKLYTVDRNTANLYVYSWASSTNTLTLDAGFPITLPGVTSAHGLALDELRDRLYVGDRSSTTVRYFDPATWTETGNFDLALSGQTAMGIAVDPVRNMVYTGNAYAPYGSLGRLVKYDLNTSTETFYTLPGAATGDNIVGVAVDVDTGYVYATTGNQGSGGTDTIIVFDSNLNVLKNDIGDIGNPTGIAIPIGQVSYNPLNFTKTDSPDPVPSGSNLTYTICYDNTANTTAVNNVTITDDIPAGTTFVSATGPFVTTPTTITWSISSVAAGAPQVCYNLVVNVTASDGSIITNSATIDSDETPPTSQTALTLVGAGGGNGGGITFKGKGEGGIGSTGPLELLFGLLALPLILVRRIGRRASSLVLVSLLTVIFTVTITSNAIAAENRMYLGAGAGLARTDASASDYDASLANLGYTTSSTIDTDNAGWKLFIGYNFNKNLALEGSYVNLGEVTTETVVSSGPAGWTPQDFVDAAATVHPYSVSGFTLEGKVTWPISEQISLFGNLGVFAWNAEILVTCVGCPTTVQQPNDVTGTSYTGGIGAGYDFKNNIGVRLEYERYGTDRDDVDFFSASVLYRYY